MARFILFRYEFEPKKRVISHNLFDYETQSTETLSANERMRKKQEFFASIFENNNLHFRDKKKEFKHKLLFNSGGFIVFQLANERSYTVERDFKFEKHQQDPSILVLIDNRKDRQFIAIEDKGKAFSSVETVRKILNVTFVEYLEKEGLNISINQCYNSNEFWDIVKQYQNKIYGITFQFKYPNLPTVYNAVKEVVKDVSRELGSKKTSLSFQTEKDDHLDISKSNPDLVALNDHASETGIPTTFSIQGESKKIHTGHTELSIREDNIRKRLDDNKDKPNVIIDFLNKIFKKCLPK
jgi:hypothetical protein